MAASMRVQYTHGGIKPWHTTLATMCILCHRQYVLQDFSLTMDPIFLSSTRRTIRWTMCLKFCFLNLEDNACSVDNLSTILLTAAASRHTSADDRDRLSREQFQGQQWPWRWRFQTTTISVDFPQTRQSPCGRTEQSYTMRTIWKGQKMKKRRKGTKRPRQSTSDQMEESQE